ncbi:MAG: tyrosine-type recombinase/integrase [Candidatus Daviesbacteria bacterium]|nr:tyrosine-type recombinase/integrase [Candidatus Daviesbacteria bacterium]
MRFSKAALQFLEDLSVRPISSRHTIKNYDHHLRRFWSFTGDIDTSEITPVLIKKYAKFLSEKNLKKTTQNYHLIALRALLHYLEENHIPALSAESVTLLSSTPREIKSFEADKLRLVIEAPDTTSKEGLRDRCILEILLCTGLRVTALVQLNRDDVDLTQQKIADNPLSNSACRWLETYQLSRKDTFAPLFIRFQGVVNVRDAGESMRLTERSVERVVKKYAKELNLPNLTPESFRQYYGLELVEHGADIKTVAEKLGHQHTVTTKAFLKAAEINQS